MLLSATIALAAALTQGAWAICCGRGEHGLCQYPDGSWRDRRGFCCGEGTCNVFCCKCADGCIRDNGRRVRRATLQGNDLNAEVCYPSTGGIGDCGKATFLKANLAGDGKMSLEEFISWAGTTFPSSPMDGIVAHFHAFDANGDGFLSEDEIQDAQNV